MTLLALVLFVGAALLAALGERLGRLLPPASAVRLLTTAAFTSALGMGLVLAATALTVLGQLPAAAAAGHWSAAVLRQSDPLPAYTGALLALAVIVPLSSALLRASQHLRDLAAAEVTCRRLGPAPAGLVIIPSDLPDAYTLPGLTGRTPARSTWPPNAGPTRTQQRTPVTARSRPAHSAILCAIVVTEQNTEHRFERAHQAFLLTAPSV